jgi:putative flippase GtrA
VVAVLTEAAGQDVAVAVAIAAIAALVASYVRIGLLTLRSLGQPDATERMERRGRAHLLIMLGAPLVVLAARPWGMATIAVAGAMFLCQPLFLHAMVVAGLLRQRRAHRSPPPL